MADLRVLAAEAARCFEAGDLARARNLIRQVLAAAPNAAQAHQLAAQVELGLGALPGAIEHAQRAVALAGDRPHLHANLGAVLLRARQPAVAVDVLTRAANRFPANPEIRVNLTLGLLNADRPADALESAGLLVDAPVPASVTGRVLASTALATMGRADEAIGTLTEVIEKQGAGGKGKADPRLLVARAAYGVSSATVSNAQLARWHAEAAAAFAAPAGRFTHPPQQRGARLRLGFISPDLRTHSVAQFIEPVLAGLDRERCEVFVYHTAAFSDATTARLRSYPATWREGHPMTDDALAAVIAGDQLDALFDLAGFTNGHRLGVLARRPAPVQVNYLGYAHPTYAPFIDARLVDRLTDPDAMAIGALPAGRRDGDGREPLVALEPVFLHYHPATSAAVGVPPRPAGGGAGRPITFGCFGTLHKYTDAQWSLWSQTLWAIPGSRLVLKAQALADVRVQTLVRERCVAAGIEADRLSMHGFDREPRDHLARYAQIDIALDTFPYHGTTTTCEALSLGVPTVTLLGDRHAARVGATLLRAVGLEELVATTPDEFVRRARELATDPARLATLRVELPGRLASSALGRSANIAEQLIEVAERLTEARSA